MLSLWVISQSLLHFDKIHKNNISILIIPTLSSNLIFVDIIAYFRSWRKENSSRISAHGIYWSGKLFLQPIELHEISIMTNSWNYFMTKSLRKICARPGFKLATSGLHIQCTAYCTTGARHRYMLLLSCPFTFCFLECYETEWQNKGAVKYGGHLVITEGLCSIKTCVMVQYSWRGDSNEYPLHMFLSRNKENHPSIILQTPTLSVLLAVWSRSTLFAILPALVGHLPM